MKLHELKMEGFRGISEEFTVSAGGKNLLMHGENGSCKSSVATALELLIDPRQDRDLLFHRNRFGGKPPRLEASFYGDFVNIRPADQKQFLNGKTETIEWTEGTDKPLPEWIVEGAQRSAFLNHRKLLLLSDRTRDLEESFFLVAVDSLFRHLPAGSSGETIGSLWDEVSEQLAAYRTAKAGKGKEGATGVSNPVAHAGAVEKAVTLLNQALSDYLQPAGDKKSRLVEEAQQLLSFFGDSGIDLDLHFPGIGFSRADDKLSGAFIQPKVEYCQTALGDDYEAPNKGSQWKTDHHLILNEARLTALSLSLFLAAAKIANSVSYIPGNQDPQEPLRLLVLDDVLVGLDYDHRIPVLELLGTEFKEFQVILLTHDRTWFDIARLELEAEEDSPWIFHRIFSMRGKGPVESDAPCLDTAPIGWLDRADWFLSENRKEYPAAANYARTAIEHLLKSICHRRSIPIPFRLDPEKHNTEVFLSALKDVRVNPHGTHHLIPLDVQHRLKALRKNVLNPLSHAHPNNINEIEVRRAIEVGRKLMAIETRLPKI